ncbi:SsrA-binding protein [Lacunisphaera limnophila]|uniref:SsrA-binding protein n=1 Tax=Lacunisphaera limnophila TaxID=1838286 RepID=A0A1D8AX58_9BACT|nr:SsrA-binding protein SmpB [Lacunisphaera limnophila]AOS45485.1 SsrA-binding protein [Lacunisphaera limnophila]
MAAQKHDPTRYTEMRNAKALRDYFVHDKFEAGVKLTGTEVKSIRAGKAQITDAFARIEKGEVWLYNAYIEEYSHGGLSQHSPRRPRKLLLRQPEIRKLLQEVETAGRQIVALRMYFKEALVKVEIATATGKKQFDKREDLKKREQNLEARRALHSRR